MFIGSSNAGQRPTLLEFPGLHRPRMSEAKGNHHCCAIPVAKNRGWSPAFLSSGTCFRLLERWVSQKGFQASSGRVIDGGFILHFCAVGQPIYPFIKRYWNACPRPKRFILGQKKENPCWPPWPPVFQLRLPQNLKNQVWALPCFRPCAGHWDAQRSRKGPYCCGVCGPREQPCKQDGFLSEAGTKGAIGPRGPGSAEEGAIGGSFAGNVTVVLGLGLWKGLLGSDGELGRTEESAMCRGYWQETVLRPDHDGKAATLLLQTILTNAEAIVSGGNSKFGCSPDRQCRDFQ